MASWSFRIRLLVGTILWTLGLLALSHLLFLFVARRHSIVFRIDHCTLLAIAVVGMLAGVWEARRGLLPFRRLREGLAAVREGTAPRIEGRFPSEVQPLVNDLNALLAHREETVRRAMAKAGDLAHGLKTPLAVLTQEAELAGAQGHPELAAALEREIERMRRQIDYHLAHARAAGAGAATPGARSSVRDAAEASPGRSEGCMPTTASRSSSRSRRSTPSASSARSSTRCSATSWTTPAASPAPAPWRRRRRASAS